MKVSILEGSDGYRAIADPTMRAQWSALHESCQWSTVFQGVPFATAWYRVYEPAFEPVIAVGREADGSLAGLLLLARDRATGGLVHVGEKHAEYQTWISASDRPEFIGMALDAARDASPRAILRLRYVPPNAPLNCLLSASGWRWRTVSKIVPRGIADLSAAGGITSLIDNSRYRYRMRRLRALGAVEFRQISDRAQLEPWLDQLIACCDLRQGAINAAFPFREDPLKRELHLAMLDEPELLHVTLLTAGTTFVSAQINFRDRHAISLGLVVHSPTLGKLSPGTLHLLLLARLAREQGFGALDLTPGGEYKDRFASHAEPTFAVDVQFSAVHAVRAQARHALVRVARRPIRRLGLDPAEVREQWLGKVATVRDWFVGSSGTSRASNGTARPGEVRMYRVSREAAGEGLADDVRVGMIADLILPDASGAPLLSRRPLLRAALTRLERGEQLLSVTRDGMLAQSAWLAVGPARVELTDGSEPHEIAASETLLHGFTCFGSDAVSDAAFLVNALRCAASGQNVTMVHVAVSAEDRPLVRQLDTLGAQLEWQRVPTPQAPVATPPVAAGNAANE